MMLMAISAGVSDLILTASFHNQEEMFEFIAQRLSHVPGVNRTQTSVCMRVVKKSHEWATDLTMAISEHDPGVDAPAYEDAAESVLAGA
jgi:DNA-binding Lrp family transcriptional regulator